LKDVITEDKLPKYIQRLGQILVQTWKMSNPIIPKMKLVFKVSPYEVYFSTPGSIFWISPFWRGDAFVEAILFHEGHHWNIYPVDLFRGLKEMFDARRLLAEEEGFKPKKIKLSLWAEEEDWKDFKYTLEEIQFVQNILGDYLINLHIRKQYPTVWRDTWNFISSEGTVEQKGMARPRDSAFMLYIAVYPLLCPELQKIHVKEQASRDKMPKIAELVRQVQEAKISTTFALKEMVKLFHDNIESDKKEGEKEQDEDMKCPQCGNDEWEITEYQKDDGTWVKV
jgi:hypothetical protein